MASSVHLRITIPNAGEVLTGVEHGNVDAFIAGSGKPDDGFALEEIVRPLIREGFPLFGRIQPYPRDC